MGGPVKQLDLKKWQLRFPNFIISIKISCILCHYLIFYISGFTHKNSSVFIYLSLGYLHLFIL